MAEPELPPWLTQQSDPIGSIRSGVQIGGALAGVINQRKLTDSRLRLEEQDAQIKHMEIEQAIKEKDEQLKADFIIRELPEKIAPLLEAGKGTPARNVVLSLAARNPYVMKSKWFPPFLEMVEGSVKTEEKRIELDRQEKEFKSIDALRQSQITENSLLKDTRTTDQKNVAAYLSAVDSGDTRTAELMLPKLQERGWKITHNPDGSFMVQQGAMTNDMPAATVTRANESLLGARSANAIGRELIPLLTPLTIGPGGMVKRVVITKGLANLIPSLKAGDEIDVESLATAYRSDITRALRVDQMAESERKEIKAALPDEKAIFESPQSAVRAIQNFNRIVATRAKMAAKQAGLPVPFDLMSPSELLQEVKALRMDRATAEKLALDSPFADEMVR